MRDTNTSVGIGRRRVLVTAGGVVLAGLGPGAASAGKGDEGKGKGKDEEKGKGKGKDEEKGKGKGKDKNEEKGKGKGKGKGKEKGKGKNTCPDGTVLLAKYEVRGGEFVFEKGGEYLDVGDGYEFTVDATKDGGEVLAFTVEDPDGVYNINALSVKTGAGVFTKTGTSGTSISFDARDHDDSGPVQAISNVLICSEVFVQVDFGKGDVPIPPRYSDGGLDNLVLAAVGNSSTDYFENPFRDYDSAREYVDVDADPVAFDIDTTAGTVRIDFENNTDNERLHLAAFKTPGPLRPGEGFPEIPYQELHEEAYTTADSGSMTVDLPTPDDFS